MLGSTGLVFSPSVISGGAGYAPSDALLDAWREGRAARLWRLGPRVVSLQLAKQFRSAENNGIWKDAARLPLTDPEAQLAELAAIGIRHPSSYADAFHQLAPRIPPLRYTFNGIFRWWAGGPWSEALKIGHLPGQWSRYDLRSAYRWAGSQGLPDPQSYRALRGSEGHRSTWPGLWVVRILSDPSQLPICYRTPDPVLMSSEEIAGYGCRVEYIRGVVWTGLYDPNYLTATFKQLPCAKESGRAYWGRWIARDPLVCATQSKEWNLRNIYQHFLWGWLIVGRVRLRVWQAARNGAAHVYVDEVLVRGHLETGDKIGDWHLKETYRHGIIVRRTGWYGPAGDTYSSTMQTGVKHVA